MKRAFLYTNGIRGFIINWAFSMEVKERGRQSRRVVEIDGDDGRGFLSGWRRVMSCELCSSANQAKFSAEMMIHFSGLTHLVNPGILIFPKVLICLDCGFSRFNIPEIELRLLRKANAPSRAA
jgi:hypothetical protein